MIRWYGLFLLFCDTHIKSATSAHYRYIGHILYELLVIIAKFGHLHFTSTLVVMSDNSNAFSVFVSHAYLCIAHVCKS